MTDPKPTNAEQFAEFFLAALPTRNLIADNTDDTDNTQENDQ